MTKPTPAVAVLAVLAGAAVTAFGQSALGDGRGQENRAARKYPQTDQPRGGRDFAAEVQFRNAIVTGNAPGGLSFRGGAPYTSPTSFRGVTAADDLYSFRRDSFYSGLSGQGIRGTEALQYQFAMTTGSAVPRGIVGSLDVPRPGDKSITLARDTRPREETAGSDWLRSPSSYASSRSLRPTALGERPIPNDTSAYLRLMSSSLLGLKVQRVEVPKRPSAAVPPTTPVTPTPSAASPTAPGTPAGPATPAAGAGPDKPEPGEVRTSYDDLKDRLASWSRAKPAEHTAPGAEKPLPGDRPADDAAKPWERRIEALRRHLLGMPVREVDETDKAPLSRDDEVTFLNPDTLRMLRDTGGQVKTFAEVPPERAALPLYLRAMALGQENLAAERYFDAEDKFSRALAVRPRDASAQAGRIHAQLGAGMFLSAAVNLRELLVVSPEVAGVKYAPALLPSPARLTEITAGLAARVKAGAQDDPLARSLGDAEVGLLLAYVGYQTGDDQTVKDGLATLGRRGEGESDDDKLVGRMEQYLRGVWLGDLPPELPADLEVKPAGEKPAEPPSAAKPDEKPPEKPAK